MPFLQDSKLLQTNVPLGELLGIEYYGIPDLRICRSLLNVSPVSYTHLVTAVFVSMLGI